jgi:hypothetical protein
MKIFQNLTVEKKLAQYKQNWLDYVRRMENVRHPKQLLTSDPSEDEGLDDH